MVKISILKERIICHVKRLLSPRGTEIIVSELPLFSFKSEDVIYNFNTTNNTIKTPKGYFRICLEHLPYNDYLYELSSLYKSVPEGQKPKRGYDFFIRKGIRDWKLNSNKYKYQTYNVCSSMAEEKVAEMLGLERLLTHSFFCRLQIDDGKELVGTMSSVAKGVDVRDLKDCFETCFTPELDKELTNLNLIDTICYEKDHRPGNYHIILNAEGRAISVCSFDNDSPWSFSPFGGASFKTYAGASEFVLNGKINRPLIDYSVLERVLSLSEKDVEDNLGHLLGNNQVRSCWRRVSLIQGALKKTVFQDNCWSEEIIKKELSGTYGNTYYSVLWNLCVDIKNGRR